MSYKIERADKNATLVMDAHGADSKEYEEALLLLDIAIEEEALSNDGWSDAEIRAMDGVL